MHQYSQGIHTTQGHKAIPENHFEEEQGRKGFFGPVSHLIKPQPSTRWTQIDGPLRPHLFDCVKLPHLTSKWQRLLYNNDVVISYLHEVPNSQPKEAFRNADGETLYFCHQGEGVVLTEYGLLHFRPGTYLMIPKCVTHSLCPQKPTVFLVVESRTGQGYREPERGMVGRNGFYDPASFGKPDLAAQVAWIEKSRVDVRSIRVQRGDEFTRFEYESNVFDTVGWKGDFFPFTLHIQDLMPLISARVHLPPSAHSTFVSQNFVVCTFLPRPLETDPDALKVPFYHQNIDYDEVLFYHDGNFFSRDNLHSGMISFHPAGFPHGPHPKAVKNVGAKTHTDEVAVMIDAWNPLKIHPDFAKVEVPEYWQSWKK